METLLLSSVLEEVAAAQFSWPTTRNVEFKGEKYRIWNTDLYFHTYNIFIYIMHVNFMYWSMCSPCIIRLNFKKTKNMQIKFRELTLVIQYCKNNATECLFWKLPNSEFYKATSILLYYNLVEFLCSLDHHTLSQYIHIYCGRIPNFNHYYSHLQAALERTNQKTNPGSSTKSWIIDKNTWTDTKIIARLIMAEKKQLPLKYIYTWNVLAIFGSNYGALLKVYHSIIE